MFLSTFKTPSKFPIFLKISNLFTQNHRFIPSLPNLRVSCNFNYYFKEIYIPCISDSSFLSQRARNLDWNTFLVKSRLLHNISFYNLQVYIFLRNLKIYMYMYSCKKYPYQTDIFHSSCWKSTCPWSIFSLFVYLKKKKKHIHIFDTVNSNPRKM